MKTVYIKSEGCDVFPHLSIHEVIREDDTTYYTKGDRFPKKWGDDITDSTTLEFINIGKLKYVPSFLGHFTEESYDWDTFRRLGYYKDGIKTNHFQDFEYKEFEKYSEENKLDINKYE